MERMCSDPPQLFAGENSGFFPQIFRPVGFSFFHPALRKTLPASPCSVYINKQGHVSRGQSLAGEETLAPPLSSSEVIEEVRGQAT